ncbi:uncharacterized protein [Argopecten irradians]|uniref:uncharacterized protein n=1 Tax=Argopecten irradians TaxID=31199 RepID=UPI003722BC12
MAGSTETTYLTEDEIDRLTVINAVKIARDNNISTDGLKKLKEIHCKLKSKLIQDKRQRREIIKSLESEAAENHDLRNELHSIYEEVINLLKNVEQEDKNNPLIDLLQRHYNNILDQLQKEKGKLSGNTSRCPILVLGETGAGKSSFINLLLGEEALPTQLLSNTNVICEIQYADNYWAILYCSLDDDSESIKKIKKDDKSEFFKCLGEHIQKSEDDTTTKYRKAKIYLPCDILKSGLVIVDSPGIGDTKEMTDMVLDYILEACSFIYIINSANAGGVQEERVVELVSQVVKKAFTDQFDYRPECALFVCNKWDRVPLLERKEIWEDTVRKLQSNNGWPDCKTSQIFCISTMEASYVQKEEPHYVYGQFSCLIEEVLRLIPKSREVLLVNSTRFLARFLENCIFCIDARLPKDGMTEADRKRDIEEHKKKLYEIKDGIEIFFKDQKKTLKRRIISISEDLSKYLMQKDVIEEICDIKKYEKAVRAGLWADAMVCTRSELYTQITTHIQKWEKTTGLLDKASKQIGKEFREKFPTFGAQISNTEKKFQDGGNRTVVAQEDEPFIPLSVARRFETLDMGLKVLVGVGMAPVLLLGVILRLPVYAFVELKRKITQVTLEATFHSNDKKQQGNAVRKYAESVLRSVVDPLNLGPLMIKEVKPLFGYLKKQCINLTNEVDARLKVMEEAEEDMMGADAFKIKFAPVREKFRKFQGRTLFFLHMHMHKPHAKDCIPESSLVESGRISDGCMSYIMEADKKSIQGYQTVAVRHCKIPTDASNIMQVLEDDKHYRYSTLVQTIGCMKTSTEIAQVMEPLSGCLRKHLSRTVSSLERPRYLQRLAESVVNGLQYLHHRNLVHMDLSLDTIMVDLAGKVKLVNLSSPRKLPASLFPLDGAAIRYVHFEGRLMCKPNKYVYTIQHDIYSVGIMMYEMWTGHHAFQDRMECGMKHLSQFIDILEENDFLAFPLLKKEKSLKNEQVWIDTIESCLYEKVKTPDDWFRIMANDGSMALNVGGYPCNSTMAVTYIR